MVNFVDGNGKPDKDAYNQQKGSAVESSVYPESQNYEPYNGKDNNKPELKGERYGVPQFESVLVFFHLFILTQKSRQGKRRQKING